MDSALVRKHKDLRKIRTYNKVIYLALSRTTSSSGTALKILHLKQNLSDFCNIQAKLFPESARPILKKCQWVLFILWKTDTEKCRKGFCEFLRFDARCLLMSFLCILLLRPPIVFTFGSCSFLGKNYIYK